MPIATLSSKGQITLPKEMRDDLRLETGSQVMFVRTGSSQYQVVARTRTVEDIIGYFHEPSRAPMSIDDMNAAIAAGGAASGLGIPVPTP